MKKTFSNFRTLAALLMAGAAFAACSSDDNIIENQQPANPGEQVYTLTINASKGDATTRALDLDGTKLVASWADGDELSVYNASKTVDLTGTLTASNASGSTATFSGALTGTIEAGNSLVLNYHPIDIANFYNQDGTLKGTNGAEKYDKAFADVTVASVDGSGNITINEASANFSTKVAMLKLTLQDGSSNLLNPTSLTISVDGIGDLYTFSPTADTYTANGNGILYFAMPSSWDVAYNYLHSTLTDAVEAATVTFTATVGGTTYTATKPGYKFAAGHYYAATLTMTPAPITVTWNSFPTSGYGYSFSQDGVTLTAEELAWYATEIVAATGEGEFTTTLGNFTKIEITADSFNMGAGWTVSGNKATWTGNASTVTFGSNSWNGPIRWPSTPLTMVFTIQPN